MGHVHMGFHGGFSGIVLFAAVLFMVLLAATRPREGR